MAFKTKGEEVSKENIRPEYQEAFEITTAILKSRISGYILFFGTDNLERVLNDIFDDIQVKKIKLETKYKLSKKTIKAIKQMSPIK